METEFYISAFMYELEVGLNKSSELFKDINFHLDEANTDKESKSIIKKYIMNNFVDFIAVTTVSIEENLSVIENDKFRVIDVLLPEELLEEDKIKLKQSSNSIYTNPDLLIRFEINGTIIEEPIEIKSTKNNNIPGSSIQQISKNGWVIFIKHKNEKIEFATGKYVNSINGTIQFPDRSPRPQVSFEELKKWNSKNRLFENGELILLPDENTEAKYQLLDDWQLFLSERWIDILKSDKKKNCEPWFNNNLRKFALLLLSEYDDMSQIDKKEFLEKIEQNIEGAE